MSRHPVLKAVSVGLVLIIALSGIYIGISSQLEAEAKQREEILAKARRDSIAAEQLRMEEEIKEKEKAKRREELARLGIDETGIIDLDLADSIVNSSRNQTLQEKTATYNLYIKGRRLHFQANVSIVKESSFLFFVKDIPVARFTHPFLHDTRYSGVELDLGNVAVRGGSLYDFECVYGDYLSLGAGNDEVRLISRIGNCKKLR